MKEGTPPHGSMQTPALHQPHDKLFRGVFSQPDNAAAFLRSHLPSEIVRLLAWQTLTTESIGFTDANYLTLESDLSYAIRFHNSDEELLILVEHQSSQQPMFLLRALGYVTRTWERLIRAAGGDRLPPLLCVVVAQSPHAWAGPVNLAHLVRLSPEATGALRSYQPSLGLHVVDLFSIPYDQIFGTPDGVLALRALKAQPTGELLSEAVWDTSVIKQVSPHTAEMFLRYVLNAEDNKEAVLARAEKVQSKSFLTNAMTIAQQLIEEGRIEGRLEGRQEGSIQGSQRSVLLCLEIRFGQLPDSLRKQISAVQSIPKLESILASTVNGASFEQITQALE